MVMIEELLQIACPGNHYCDVNGECLDASGRKSGQKFRRSDDHRKRRWGSGEL
jgi:hypothetical protein